VKFRTFSCGSVVATSSMVTTMAEGKKVDDANEITRKNVAEIRWTTPNKADALKEAIDNYRGKVDA